MLQQLYDLGEYVNNKTESENTLEPLLSDLDGIDTVLPVDFVRTDEGFEFSQVSILDFGSEEISKEDVLYAEKHSNIPHHTPTGKITRIHDYEAHKNPDTKTGSFSLRVAQWFERKDEQFANELSDAVEESREKLQNELKSKYESLGDKKSNAVLSVRIAEKDENFLPIGEFDYFRAKALEGIKERWWDINGGSKSDNGVCCVCNSEGTVFGYAFPFNFYTVNNPKFAPDFDQGKSWENIPVCENCALKLELSKNYLESGIQARFSFLNRNEALSGIDYFVIPSFPIGVPNEDLMKRIELSDVQSNNSFLKAERFYEGNEDDYPFYLTFLFIEESDKSWEIQKYIEDIAPSNIRDSQQKIGQKYSDIYDDLNPLPHQTENESVKQLRNLIIRTLPQPDRDDGSGDKQAFLNELLFLTENVLKREGVEFDHLLNIFVPEALSRFRNNEYYQQYVVRTFLFLEFLKSIESVTGYDTMYDNCEELVEALENVDNETLEDFFSSDKYGEAFGSSEKRAVFLEGVLAQHLMDQQMHERDSNDAPFRKKLANLRLDEKKAKRLLPQIRNHMEIYSDMSDNNYSTYGELWEATSKYFLNAEENGWNISDDEIRYYFTLGLSLNQVFKNNSQNGGE
jgi:CRISPR-associated protein Csh1